MVREEHKKDTKANKIPASQKTPGMEESQDTTKSEDTMMKLKEKEKEAAENFDKYMRAVAELENYNKRAAKEKAESIKYGNENLLKDILPLADSLDRACRHACTSEDFEAFKAGLKLLQDQLCCCLEKHGVEKIEVVGKDFDPNVHEALLQVNTEEHGDNKVVDEFEKGYLLNSRLLRPAKVSVSKRTKQKI
jgi:molecular chaperone GrpE